MSIISVVSCQSDEWTKVADNVVSGTLINEDRLPCRVAAVATGDPAPSDLDETVPFPDISMPVSHGEHIDVYIYAAGKTGNIKTMF